MHLVRTKDLIHEGIDLVNPIQGLIHVLESALELVSLPDNDFSRSSWVDSDQAREEIQALLAQVRSGDLPGNLTVSVLFAPTGPLQEISLSSGWADLFLKVAEKFDAVERLVWEKQG